jgi:hypothetical protein
MQTVADRQHSHEDRQHNYADRDPTDRTSMWQATQLCKQTAQLCRQLQTGSTAMKTGSTIMQTDPYRQNTNVVACRQQSCVSRQHCYADSCRQVAQL